MGIHWAIDLSSFRKLVFWVRPKVGVGHFLPVYRMVTLYACLRVKLNSANQKRIEVYTAAVLFENNRPVFTFAWTEIQVTSFLRRLKKGYSRNSSGRSEHFEL